MTVDSLDKKDMQYFSQWSQDTIGYLLFFFLNKFKKKRKNMNLEINKAF